MVPIKTLPLEPDVSRFMRIIRPLTTILGLDDEDRFLCPVRALKRYLAVTEGRRFPQLSHFPFP